MSFLEDLVEVYTLLYVTLENREISYVNFMFDFCGLFFSPPIISAIMVARTLTTQKTSPAISVRAVRAVETPGCICTVGEEVTPPIIITALVDICYGKM